MSTPWHPLDQSWDTSLGLGDPAEHGPVNRVAYNTQGHTAQGVPVNVAAETLMIQWDHQNLNGGETPDMSLKITLKAGIGKNGGTPQAGWALVTPIIQETWTFGGGGGLDKPAQGSVIYDLGMLALSDVNGGVGTSRNVNAWLAELEWVAPGTHAGRVWWRFGNRYADKLTDVPTLV